MHGIRSESELIQEGLLMRLEASEGLALLELAPDVIPAAEDEMPVGRG